MENNNQPQSKNVKDSENYSLKERQNFQIYAITIIGLVTISLIFVYGYMS